MKPIFAMDDLARALRYCLVGVVVWSLAGTFIAMPLVLPMDISEEEYSAASPRQYFVRSLRLNALMGAMLGLSIYLVMLATGILQQRGGPGCLSILIPLLCGIALALYEGIVLLPSLAAMAGFQPEPKWYKVIAMVLMGAVSASTIVRFSMRRLPPGVEYTYDA